MPLETVAFQGMTMWGEKSYNDHIWQSWHK